MTTSSIPAAGKAAKAAETILLADDEQVVRGFLAGVLARDGYRVLAASDGEKALALSERFPSPIHLLVTDLMMPVMNGKELANRLCTQRPEIRVLFISGFSRRDFWPDEACEDLTDWLPKPFSATDLLRRVRELLDTDR